MSTVLGGGATAALALVLLLGVTALGGGEEAVYTAELRGGEGTPTTQEMPPGTARLTRHTHEAIYQLDLPGAEGVTAIHVHAGSGVRDGPVRVYLFRSARPVRRFYAPLEGRFGEGDVHGSSFHALMEDLAVGRAYVDIHLDGRADGLRGQVRRRR